jgi:hypothetical protein
MSVADQLKQVDASNSIGSEAQLRQQIQQAAAPSPAQLAPSPIDQDLAGDQAAQQRLAMQQVAEARAMADTASTVVPTEIAKGFLGAVTAPGALFGAEQEAVGHALGWSGLEDFGRHVGQASTGESALEAAAFLFGGGGQHGLTTSERVANHVSQAEKTWPNLSAVSRVAGGAAPLLVGGAASAGARGLAAIGAGAYEGAAGGAQQAYEKNEALRDVVSSALVGGALGGGTAALGEGVQGLLNNKALRAAAREMAEDQNLAAVGVERSQLAGLAGEEAGALDSKASELAGAIKDYRFREGPLAGKSIIRALRTPEGLAPGIEQAANETEAALSVARREAAAAAEKAGIDPGGEILKNGEQYWGRQTPEAISDEFAQKALEATGGDVAGFQALRGRAQAFKELASILGKASESEGAKATLTDSLPAIAGVGKLLSGGSPLAAVAHSMLVTVGKKLVQQRAASTMATLANTMVLDTVSSALGHIMPAIEVSAGQAAGTEGAKAVEPPKRRATLAPEQQQERYQEQLDKVNEAVSNPDPEKRMSLLDKVGDFPTPFVISAGGDMAAKMAQLHADMPKPTPNLRGKAYETLSSQQVQLANAMYEATTDPMSVFSDFAAGNVDYDKVQYAWKQYPGLKTAAQAGLMDILQVRLTDKTRGTIPDGMLTQLDNLFGFEGSLQPSLDRGFSSRMDQLMQSAPPQPKPQSSGPLKLPGSQPTFTERLSGQRG